MILGGRQATVIVHKTHSLRCNVASKDTKRLVDSLKNKYGDITVYTCTHNIHKKNGDYNYTRVELPYNAVLRMINMDDDSRRSITAILCLKYKDAEDEKTRQRILRHLSEIAPTEETAAADCPEDFTQAQVKNHRQKFKTPQEK